MLEVSFTTQFSQAEIDKKPSYTSKSMRMFFYRKEFNLYDFTPSKSFY